MDEATGSLPRLIAPGCVWTGGCMAASVSGMLAHYSCFLLMGSQRSILIDTGHPAHAEQVERDVVAALAGRPLDYIFPTHAELPHSGLLERWLSRWPQAVAVGDLRDWPLYLPHLTDRMRHVEGGETLDLGDRNFLFVPPVWRDLPDTLWGFDPTTRILFLSDACACFHPHTPGQSDHLSSEVAAPEVALMQDFNSKALHWPRFTDNAEGNAAMDALLARLDPAMLASAHGAVVDNWRDMLPLFKAGMARAA
ncbi:MBL fold metallo-hydrolase [Falsiroseomonas sp. E2-1-a20]|uniref:MBL fold metallo-hydrolase n=1 Tax=Falsiroseomonas sp. E2-1-a20 TaxID=3239300 RepID=UPI003F35168F